MSATWVLFTNMTSRVVTPSDTGAHMSSTVIDMPPGGCGPARSRIVEVVREDQGPSIGSHHGGRGHRRRRLDEPVQAPVAGDGQDGQAQRPCRRWHFHIHFLRVNGICAESYIIP